MEARTHIKKRGVSRKAILVGQLNCNLMNRKSLLTLILISALAAIVVVVTLKLLGHSNPTVIGGGVAGGIAGAISSNILRRKRASSDKIAS